MRIRVIVSIISYLIIFAAEWGLASDQREYTPPDQIADQESRFYQGMVLQLNRRFDGFYQRKQETRMRTQKRRKGAHAHKLYRQKLTKEYKRRRLQFINQRRQKDIDVAGKLRHEAKLRKRILRAEKARKYHLRHRQAIDHYRNTAKRVSPEEDVGLKP